METSQAQVLKPGDLEGLVLDKFFVDAFKPKLCDEKDIAVVNFLVKKRDPANDLSSYIAQGQFDLIDVEASSSPDEDGNYTLLVEMNRNHDMFDTMDNLLKHINELVNIKQWHFKPQDHQEFIVWNKENFVNTVPQSLEAYFDDQDAYIYENQNESAIAGADGAEFNYQLLGQVIEERITKSNQAYIRAFQKQFKVIIKGNQSLIRHIEDLKSDHQYLHQQLELYEQREKMALLREQQGFKRIRALEHKLSLLGPYDAENSEIVIPKASVPVSLKSAEVSDAFIEPSGDKGPGRVDKEGAEQVGADAIDPAPLTADEGDPVPGNDAAPSGKSTDIADREDIVPDIDTSGGDTTQSDVTRVDDGKSKTADEGLHVSEPPAGPPKDDVKKLVAQGLAAVKAKDYLKAIEYFTRVTHLIPNARRSLLRLAVLYYRLKDYNAARQHAHRALDLGADSANRILAKIDAKQAVSADEPASEEPVESPTEEAIIWATDDFDESAIDAAVAEAAQRDDVSADQDVIIFGQAEEEKSIEGAHSLNETPDEYRAVGETPPSTETVVLDFETMQAMGAEPPSAVKPDAFSETDKAREYFSLGLKAFEQKEFHQAIDYFTKVTELLPNARRSFIRLAALYYRLNDYDMAQIHANKALDLGSASAKRILEKIKHKQAEEAKKSSAIEYDDTVSEMPTFDNLQEVSPKDVEKQAGEESGAFLRDKKDAQKARATQASPQTARAKDSHPKGANAKKHFTLGVKAFEKKEYPKAVEHFTRVTQLLPQAPRSFMRLAVLYYRLKDYENARNHAQKALDLGSEEAQRILEKIDKKQAAGADPSAPDEFADTLPEFPTLDIMESDDLAAEIAAQTDEDAESQPSASPDQTADDSDQVLSDPADEQDLTEYKLESATETISLDADTLLSSGIPQMQEKESDAFPKTDPVSDYFALGLAAAEQESYHKAIENFTKVTELLPDAPASYLNLANLYLKLKDRDQAKENALRAADLGSESAKRILEQLEAEKWEASAMSPSSPAESAASE
jgi:tetratricopeptide (TPR) repeat protein